MSVAARWAAPLPLVLLLCSACAPGLGEPCARDSDCASGLRCSASGGKRGVCTYPEGVPDLGRRDRQPDSPPSDRGPSDAIVDGPLHDLGSEGTPDLARDATSDRRSDLPAADARAEGGLSDAKTPQ